MTENVLEDKVLADNVLENDALEDGVATATPPKGLLRKVTGLISSQPLLVAQMFMSASGAGAMVMAAAAMHADAFVQFSLLTLITVTLIGAVRSVLFQPALIEMRQNSDSHIHVRAAVTAALIASGIFAISAFALGVRQPGWLVVLAFTTVLPILAEWLRIRGMALDERVTVARGDALRFAATLLGIAVLFFSIDALVFTLFINLTYLTTIVYLVMRLPVVSAHVSPLAFWRPATAQLADFSFGQAVSTIPLLVLGGFGPSVYIGGLRLAQTLLGPLNMVLSAAAVNLLADGATKESHADPKELIRRGRRLALGLGILSPVLVLVLLAFLMTTGFSFRGVDNHALVVGVALVGALFTTSGLGLIDTFVVRLLGHHAGPTMGRSLLVVATGAAYVWGYHVGGTDSSLIYGFIVGAIANPLFFSLPAAVLYHRYKTGSPAATS
jgi:hypothetical protein